MGCRTAGEDRRRPSTTSSSLSSPSLPNPAQGPPSSGFLNQSGRSNPAVEKHDATRFPLCSKNPRRGSPRTRKHRLMLQRENQEANRRAPRVRNQTTRRLRVADQPIGQGGAAALSTFGSENPNSNTSPRGPIRQYPACPLPGCAAGYCSVCSVRRRLGREKEG